MKKKLFLSLLSVLCIAFTFYGQVPFQVNTGTKDNPEEKWAVVEDPAVNGYVAIGNAVVNGQSRLWISSYASNGTVLTSATARDERNLIARDISIAPFDHSYGSTYYVTGWTDVAGSNQMFVGRVALNGAFLWLQINPFFPEAEEMEGVAITTEKGTTDAVALGIAYWRGNPQGSQITLSRFNAAGGLVWSQIYLEKGEWMPREITKGPVEDAFLPGNFVITGEWRESADALPHLFGARYDGNGNELWRNLYPANATDPYYGDAGYDVVYEPKSKNFCIVGAVQTDPYRASTNSTPYVLNVDPAGTLIAATVYFTPDYKPLGLYPRCVSTGRRVGEVVMAGPNYATNTTFFAHLPTISPPGAGTFLYYPWLATANSVPQPFILNDAWPEDILYTRLEQPDGYLISTNAIPGAFGANDAHFIRTNAGGRTPANCAEKVIEHKTKESYDYKRMEHQPVRLPDWRYIESREEDYRVDQKFCQDVPPPCDVDAGFTYSVNCKTVTFTNTSTGTGPFTYFWNFGDATTSTLANPVHTYAACGFYNVQMIVCNSICCDTIVQTINIPCCTATADFCATTFGRDVTLNYSTTPGTTYTVYLNGAVAAPVWNNNTTRTLPAGTHTICVKARAVVCGDTCCATVCKTFSVSDTCILAANFSYNVQPTGNVIFTDLSTPALGNIYFWQFGTGATSVLANPTYFYSTPGTYTVCLTVKRPNGADTCEQKLCKTIVIDPPCRVKANFKATHCTSTPLTVKFTNASSGALTYEWSFGTGATSTLANPVYTYPVPGTYIVCLKALLNNNCWYRACYKVIVSTVTFNNNCNVLPPNPVFLGPATPDVPIDVEVLDEESSSGSSKPVAQAGKIIPDNITEPGKLNLFPNPASQQVQAVFESAGRDAAEVTVMNASGSLVYKTVAKTANGKNQLAIPVQKLPNGIYLVRIKTNGQTLSGNFFVDNR